MRFEAICGNSTKVWMADDEFANLLAYLRQENQTVARGDVALEVVPRSSHSLAAVDRVEILVGKFEPERHRRQPLPTETVGRVVETGVDRAVSVLDGTNVRLESGLDAGPEADERPQYHLSRRDMSRWRATAVSRLYT